MQDQTCSVEDCPRPTHSRGWCGAHYKRWWRNGHPGRAGINTRTHAGPAIVYAFLNTHDDVIYVGFTTDLETRLAQHRQQPWWHEVARTRAFQFPTADAARRKEAEVIARCDPVYNVRHRTSPTGSRFIQAMPRRSKRRSSWR